MIVEILDGTDVVVQLQSQANLGTQGWQQRTLDLRPYDGHWSTLRFKLVNDNDSTVTAVWIDDVSLRFSRSCQSTGKMLICPRTETSFRRWVALFRNDTRLDFVGMGTGQFGETRATDVADRNATIANGLTSDLWITTVNTITDYYVDGLFAGQTPCARL